MSARGIFIPSQTINYIPLLVWAAGLVAKPVFGGE